MFGARTFATFQEDAFLRLKEAVGNDGRRDAQPLELESGAGGAGNDVGVLAEHAVAAERGEEGDAATSADKQLRLLFQGHGLDDFVNVVFIEPEALGGHGHSECQECG